jgi:hypothetical protein
MYMANILQTKHAIVVIYDYCLSACADYFLVASDRTYVASKSVVGWHRGLPSYRICGHDDSSKILFEHTDWYDRMLGGDKKNEVCDTLELAKDFFDKRGIDPGFTNRPQSKYAKDAYAMSQNADVGKTVLWMWNPRYYRHYFNKTKITYEHYPESQLEVDDIVKSSGVRMRVIFDP